jgi:hypothetical protein
LELKYALRDVRQAIDKYKEACDLGTFGAIKQGTFCYPESLDILVEGVKTQAADGKKMKFLRSIPRDPFTNSTEWGMRSMQDDIKSETWSGDNVFNVYTKTQDHDSRWQALFGMVSAVTKRSEPTRIDAHRAGGGVHHSCWCCPRSGAAAGAHQDPHPARGRPALRPAAMIRKAIDKYKDNCDQGYFGPPKLGADCYPDTLDVLVEGKAWPTIPTAPS